MQTPHLFSLPLAVGLLAIAGGSVSAAPPANDNINTATEVTEPLPFNRQLSTVEATTAAGDPDCVGNGPTVWFRYTPSASGWVDADTFGSDYDTTLSVYSGSPGSLTQLECNDDSGSVQSRVVVQLTAGTSYYFMAGAYAGGPGGNLVFNIAPGTPPVPVDLTVTDVAVQPKNGTAAVRLNITAGQPVPLFFVNASLVQRSGRGHVTAMQGMLVDTVTNQFELTLPLKDTTSLREHGTGFVGGPAKIVAELFYEDPSLGVRRTRIEQEVKLSPGRGR